MRKSLYALAILTFVLVSMVLAGSGCKKKVTPPPPAAKVEAPPPAPAAPAPTISLSASPSTIEKGQSSTLSWNARNAASVTIDGGIGTVEPSGSRSVSPGDSTTYTAKATGPGGTANAETRVTVTAPAAVAPPAPRALSDSEFFETRVRDIYFDYDRADIRDDARTTLQENARALAERSGLRFTVEGHADERGSEKYNLALGDKRANAAKEVLVGQGITGERVDTISYGEERPICSEHSEDCWQKNRRAHFVLR